MPGDEKTLAAIGAIATGESTARLYVAPAPPGRPERLHLCVRGAPGAVLVTGFLETYRDLLVRQTQAALRCAAAACESAGDTGAAGRLRSMAGALPAARRAADRKSTGRSVRTVSGGLPTLGPRR
ncbi:hypothetical protein [Streptomyces sp. NPDC056491]|uniref:hypothetical protein n=1 Tax=Streptomyces sp. NPDC056491 TaxID=3345837 RepID=UPI00369E8810